MMASTHSISAVAGWLAGCWVAGKVGHPVDLASTAVGAGAVAYTSWAPDMDHHGAMIARTPWTMPLRWIYVLAKTVVRIFDRRRAAVWFAHRGITHSLAFAAAAGLVTYPLGEWVAQWVPYAGLLGVTVAAGCALHTLGDCLTNCGCPLLAPFTWRKFTLGLFPTKSRRERLVAYPVFGAAAAWLGWLAMVGG